MMWADMMFLTIAWYFFGFMFFFLISWAIVISGIRFLLLPAIKTDL